MAELALATATAELPAYPCPKSPRRFTQPQLLTCLVSGPGLDGMGPTAASAHHTARTGKARKGYVKPFLVALCGSLLPVGLVAGRRCRERLRVKSFVPPVVHRRDGTVGGKCRPRVADLPKASGKR